MITFKQIIKEIKITANYGLNPEDDLLKFIQTHIDRIKEIVGEDQVEWDRPIEYHESNYNSYEVIHIHNRGDDCYGVAFTLDPKRFEGEGPTNNGEFLKIGNYKIQYITYGC